jgi:RNA polymerase sigma-70 factor (ECF subfamily)
MSADEPSQLPSSPARRTDGSLLRRIHSGEQEAATALYLRYAERVHALARSRTSSALAARLDPEDIVQSVFRTFFRRASNGHYDLPDGDELWKLLLVISLNKIRTLAGYHRAAKRDVAATVTIESEAVAEGSSKEESLKILEMIIDETLSDLPEAQREMIRLRIEGHGVAEIADKTQRSKRSVERVLQQFRSRLGRLVLEEPHDHDANA